MRTVEKQLVDLTFAEFYASAAFIFITYNTPRWRKIDHILLFFPAVPLFYYPHTFKTKRFSGKHWRDGMRPPFVKKEGNNKTSFKLQATSHKLQVVGFGWDSYYFHSPSLSTSAWKEGIKRSKRPLNAIISAPDIFKYSLLFIHFEALPCKNMMSLWDMSFFACLTQ